MALIDHIEKLYDELKQELEFFSRGQKFYSVREIMTDFSVNRRVVDGALAKLEKQNLIRREKRTGIFCNGDERVNHCKILLATPDWPSELYTEWECCLSAAAEKRGDVFRSIRYDLNRPIMPQLPKNGYDVLLFRSATGQLNVNMLYDLANCGHPVILCGCRVGDALFSYVCGDDEFAAVKVCVQLYKMHHRKVLVINAEPPSGTNRQVVSVFGSMAQMLGVEYTLLECDTKSGESSALNSYEKLKEFLKNRDRIDFSAIFAISSVTVQPIMTALREEGIRTPEDIGIISIASSNYGQFFHPALTAVSFSIEEQVHAVFEGIDYLLKNPSGIFTRKIPVKLMKRDSLLDFRVTDKGKTR